MLKANGNNKTLFILNDDGTIDIEDEKLLEQLEKDSHILSKDSLSLDKLSKIKD
jgi:hypothetical protein